jgi:signal transduction histidine kinase
MHLIHDLRNLLTVAAVSVENIQSTRTSDTHLGPDLEVVAQCLGSMFELVDEFFSTTDKLPVPTSSVDINQVIAERMWILRAALGHGIELEFEPSVMEGLVMARAIDLERVLLNLVLNAAEAMPEGGALTIETKVLEMHAAEAGVNVGPRRTVRLTVSDTGRGMPPAWERELFTRLAFDQAGGRGLGLASVNLIVLRLGGRFHVESRAAVGTTVHIDLPQAPLWLPR